MNKRKLLVVPFFAVAALIAVIACNPQELKFSETFDTSAGFYERFDYGYSGISPLFTPGTSGVNNYHGDHDDECNGPLTARSVDLGGTSGANLIFDEAFWWCAPNGPDTGHVMTGVDTLGYNHAWFSPKETFVGVQQVCWDINRTAMSHRKWTEIHFTDIADATRYPVGTVTAAGNSEARGTGGYDLGYTNPDFRQTAPNNGLFPESGTLAGLVDNGGTVGWFQNQDQWQGNSPFYGWPGVNAGADKATRYTNCLSNQSDGQTMKLLQKQVDQTFRELIIPGQIPQHPVRISFHDANYDPIKDSNYQADRLTWHWDNIRVYTTPEL